MFCAPNNGVFYLFGVDNGFNGPYFNDVLVSKDKGKTWEIITENAAWSARTRQVGVLLGEYIAMFGGHPDLTNMWRSLDGKKWELVSDDCWNCYLNNTDKPCGKFDFEFFVDIDENGEPRIYAMEGDQETSAPYP